MGVRHAVVVDDDPLMVRLLVRFLVGQGWHVRSFTSSRLALESVLADVPHLVMTDFAMPELGGDDVARAIREAFGAASPMLVLVTASGATAHESASLFDAIVDKPFRLETVAGVLRNLDLRKTSHVRLKRPVEETIDGAEEDGDEREEREVG